MTCTGPSDDEMHNGNAVPGVPEWGQQYAESTAETLPTQERMSLRWNHTSAIVPNTARYTSCTRMPVIMSCE